MRKTVINRLWHTSWLALALVLMCSFGVYAADAEIQDNSVVFVPLDNRPVNTTRVEYFAGSIGFDIIFPDEDLYATKLDGQPLNNNGSQYGDCQALAQWLLAMEAAGCDNYVISLDQVLSGGLVNSRAAAFVNSPDPYPENGSDQGEENTPENNNAPELPPANIPADPGAWENILQELQDSAVEYSYIQDVLAILAQDPNNKIVFFDTVMRLASTVGYNGYGSEEYNALREYGKVPRRKLSGSDLTIENIFRGYIYDEQGNLCQDVLAADGNDAKKELLTANDNALIKNYLASRLRKLCLIDWVTQQVVGENVYYLVGVDDSTPDVSIQTNEMAYISQKLGDQGLVFDGADELGMMSLARLYEAEVAQPVTVKVAYFGDRDDAEGTFESEALNKVIDKHISGIGASQVKNGAADIDVLVLTPPKVTSLRYFYVGELVDAYLDNVANKVPTIIIDASGDTYYGALKERLITETNLGYLLGYSNWNTIGNATGIALSQGIARYSYLSSDQEKTQASHEDFIRSLTFAFVKDLSYLPQVRDDISSFARGLGLEPTNFYKNDLTYKRVERRLAKNLSFAARDTLANLMTSNIITDLNTYSEMGITNLVLEDFHFPWYRAFECGFSVNSVKLGPPYSTEEKPNYVTYTHEPYINGYSDGTFRPNAEVYRSELSKMIAVAQNLETSSYQGLFPDVAADSWYWPYVETVVERGYLKGYENGSFRPEITLSRGEFASFLVKYVKSENLKFPSNPKSFSDVDSSKWYYADIYQAAAWGLVNGYDDGAFRPDKGVNRGEAVAMLNRLLKRDFNSDGISLSYLLANNPFKDISTDYWGCIDVLEASVKHSFTKEVTN